MTGSSTRRAVLVSTVALATLAPTIGIAIPVTGAVFTSSASPALQALMVRYTAAVEAVEHHGYTGQTMDDDFDKLVDTECEIARLIALVPAASLADLAFKSVVALREMGMPKFQIGAPVDCDAILRSFDDPDHPDLAALIDASIILDVVRMTGKAVTS